MDQILINNRRYLNLIVLRLFFKYQLKTLNPTENPGLGEYLML